MVENPEYTQWVKFPVGTTVVRKAVTRKPDGQVVSIETFRLTGVASDALTLERQNTTTQADGVTTANPAGDFRVSKSFPLPAGMAAADFAKPALKAKATGTESVEVAGKKYDATIYEWMNSTEAGPMKVKGWFADDFPGRVVKQQMIVEAAKSTTNDAIESVTIPTAK